MTKNAKTYMHAIICIVLMIGIGFLPTFGNVTPVGMKVLGVFIGMMYGWIFCGLIWPSFFGILVFGFSGLMGISEVFSSGFGNSTVVMILVCFVFVSVLEQFKVGDALAGKVFSMKFMVGRPWLMIFVLLSSACIISGISNTFLVFFIYCDVVIKIAEKCGYEKGSSFITFMIGSILFVASMGSVLVPFQATALIYMGFLTSTIDLSIGFTSYFIWMLITQMVSIILLLLVAKFIFRLDVKPLKNGDHFAEFRGKKLTSMEKIGLLITLFFMLAMILPSFMPDSWWITQFLTQLGLLGVIAVIFVVLAILQTKDGKPLGDLREYSVRGVNWDVTWLLVATMPVAAAITAEECGITSTVVQSITPILQNMTPIVFICLLVVVLGILTQVMHNLVIGALFIPLGATLLINMGGNPIVLMLGIMLAITPALGTPAGAAQSPLFHGHPWVSKKYGYIWGFTFAVVLLLAICLVGVPLGQIMF